MISTQASVRDESKNLNSGVSLSGKASKPVRDDRMCRLAERRDRLGRGAAAIGESHLSRIGGGDRVAGGGAVGR